MGTWTLRRLLRLWLTWTALLLVVAGLALWFLVTRSDNFALPLAARVLVNGRPVSPGLVAALASVAALIVLYLPPMLATLVWFVQHRRG